tara:strand:- start:668 stop:1039 length:372 start_codon:yes stop_codon:yes gene_type:complete
MSGIIGRIFGSKKSTEKLIDAAVGGIDSLFTTKEEKIEAINNHLKTVEPFKLMQRLLVLSIVFTIIFLLLVCVGFVIAGGFGFVKGNTIAESITSLVVEWNIAYAFLAIITVYISGGVLKRKN